MISISKEGTVIDVERIPFKTEIDVCIRNASMNRPELSKEMILAKVLRIDVEGLLKEFKLFHAVEEYVDKNIEAKGTESQGGRGIFPVSET